MVKVTLKLKKYNELKEHAEKFKEIQINDKALIETFRNIFSLINIRVKNDIKFNFEMSNDFTPYLPINVMTNRLPNDVLEIKIINDLKEGIIHDGNNNKRPERKY